MHFNLVDSVLEQSEDRIVTVKQVSLAEEYLQDHFAGFPVLPGVMMIESMVQAARRLLEPTMPGRLVLGQARGVKYGRFVRPGDALRVEVVVRTRNVDGSVELKGEGTVVSQSSEGVSDGGTAVSGRFLMRPIHTGRPR